MLCKLWGLPSFPVSHTVVPGNFRKYHSGHLLLQNTQWLPCPRPEEPSRLAASCSTLPFTPAHTFPAGLSLAGLCTSLRALPSTTAVLHPPGSLPTTPDSGGTPRPEAQLHLSVGRQEEVRPPSRSLLAGLGLSPTRRQLDDFWAKHFILADLSFLSCRPPL